VDGLKKKHNNIKRKNITAEGKQEDQGGEKEGGGQLFLEGNTKKGRDVRCSLEKESITMKQGARPFVWVGREE